MNLWDEHAGIIDVDRFRADRQYLGCQAEHPYAAMAKWAQANASDMLAKTSEDGAFGVTCGDDVR